MPLHISTNHLTITGATSGQVLAWNGTKFVPTTVSTSTSGGTTTVTWSEITDKPTTFEPAAHSHEVATQTSDGFMSKEDKTILDNLSYIGKFSLTQPSTGEITYAEDMQSLMDAAEPRALLTMYTHNVETPLVHKNGVTINTNGFDLPTIMDSDTSGQFAIIGGGRVGRALMGVFDEGFVPIGSSNTELLIDCELNIFTRSDDVADGTLDSKFSCKSVIFTKPVVVNTSGWLQFWGGTKASIYEGVYQIDRSDDTVYNGAVGVCLRSGFTGTVHVHTELYVPTYWAAAWAMAGSGGQLVLENVNIVARKPTTGGERCGLLIDAASTTSITFRGKNTINSTGASIKKTGTNSHTINVEGSIDYTTPIVGNVVINQITKHTTEPRVTQTTDGLMLAADKVKLDNLSSGGTGSTTPHTHAISDVTDLQTALDSKAAASHSHSNYSLTGHSHTFASLTSKPTTLAGYGISDAVKTVNGTAPDASGNITVTAGDHTHTEYLSKVNPTGQRHIYWGITEDGAPGDLWIRFDDAGYNAIRFTPQGILWNDYFIGQVATVNGVAPDNQGNVTISVSGGTTSVDWADVTNKPTTFTPAAHTHTDYSLTGHTHSNYSLTGHTHTTAAITGGTFAVARGGTGLASVTLNNFIVGNGTSAMVQKTPAQVLALIGAAGTGHTHDYLALSGGTITSPAAGTIGLVIKGVSGQTADFIQYHNSAGTPVAGVTKDGKIWGTGFLNADGTPYQTSSGGTVSGDYLPLSGGTLTGPLNVVPVASRKIGFTDSTAFSGLTSGQRVQVQLGYGNNLIEGIHSSKMRVKGELGVIIASPLKDIAVFNPNGDTTINGNLECTGNVRSLSDARLKTNVRPYENGLDKVMSLKPVVYDRTDIESDGELGFIADAVQEIEPNLVTEGEYKSLDYARICVMLTQAVQELKAEIEELKKSRG